MSDKDKAMLIITLFLTGKLLVIYLASLTFSRKTVKSIKKNIGENFGRRHEQYNVNR